MKALCMIRVLPGQVDKVLNLLKRKRRISKDVMVVSGSSDICVILNTSITDINKIVIDLKNIKEIVSTETLIEVEVDLGW
jgi:xanthine dehydrogenase iron-sulfur cluster and FAD-binding subunit A